MAGFSAVVRTNPSDSAPISEGPRAAALCYVVLIGPSLLAGQHQQLDEPAEVILTAGEPNLDQLDLAQNPSAFAPTAF